MSAGEKLGVLLSAIARNDDGAALAGLLPQIVALVEAAEFARNCPEMPSDLRWEDFDAALAALDEALP